MKQIQILLLFLLAGFLWQGCNPTQSDLQKQYSDNLKKAKDSGHDILPFPGEEPQNVKPKLGLAEQTNWGKDLLLTPATKARLVAECKNKVIVKVFDTSGKTNHSFLTQGQLPGKSYTGESGLDDGNGHGTHCAGIICADQLGITDALVDAGIVAWKPVKVLTNAGSGNFDWFANAVVDQDIENRALLAAGTFVVGSCSFGGGTAKVASVETALKASTDLGVVYCIAAGNTSGPGVQYPGNSSYAIAVGSIASNLQHSSFSSTGPEVWNGMPGTSILSTYLNNSFATLSGTSMATPFEAGIVAIVRAKWGKTNLETLAKVKNYLAWISNDLEVAGKDNFTGYGDVLVNRILDMNPKDVGNVTPPPDPNPTPPSNDSIPHTLRNQNFTLVGSWKVLWNNTNPAEAKTFVQTGKRALGSEFLTINRIEVVVPGSLLLTGTEYKHLVANTNWAFTNRGVGLANGSDYGDACYWGAYFYEMLVATQAPFKQALDVTRIDATDSNGRTVTYFKPDLKHW